MRRQTMAILCGAALTLFTVACSESDLGLTTKVRSRLETDRNLNASQIQVKTTKGVVALSGAVDSPASKEHAAGVARSVEGVKNVVNNLEVSPSVAAMPGTPAEGGNASPDTAITQAVRQKLQEQPETAAEKIDVDTRQGIVTLSGTVKTAEEKEQVIEIARSTEGVQRVEDHLAVGATGAV
jgi:hyperosmotically inducible protein